MSIDEPTDNSHLATGQESPKSRRSWRKIAVTAAAAIGALLAISGAYVGYLYASTPISIREPLYEHYHVRLQIIADGKAVNFADAAFQEGYAKDNCNAALTSHPIHFHDKKDQFVHIHWEGMTGGQVLKYYGWNYIGGPKGTLGYRFDTFPKIQSVPIHGNVLPAVTGGDSFYVYVGDEKGYKARSFNDFTSQDLEKFIGVTSNSPAHKLNQSKRSSLLDAAFPKAFAHDHQVAEAASPATGSALSTEDLTRLNNLIGNIVVFAQKDEPTDAQIKDRFNHLEPLSESSCGG
jgi:hypothetical protein